MPDIRFSILIPLEFDRGQALRCVEAWASGQEFPRERTQLVLAVPPRWRERDLDPVRALLAPHDRLERLPGTHDVSLVTEAAALADGEVLLFTESHATPEPGTLRLVDEVLRERPEWAGFSFRSIPVTHNLLSEIEAGMYAADIGEGLERHPWRKVLDQCFALRREAWAASGGLEPRYGHYAEWLFAARLHVAGLAIGYDPRPAVRHYYSGELDDLEAFTLDFASGEILFADGPGPDPCHALLPPVPELAERVQWRRGVALRLHLHRFARLVPDLLRPSPGPRVVLSNLARSAWRAAGGFAGTALGARVRATATRALLERSLASGDRERSRALFLRWMQLLVIRARAEHLRRV
jgi:hypothetical protein